ncbi:peptidoglycan-binding protein [Salinithrix halophila]|uniref:peptidoglycan-binding protein n=1 Tax=Salinithrix halophila TaxID=1485204 RepID=UPI0036D42483
MHVPLAVGERYYKVGPGPRFSEVDKKACAAFQRDQGFTWSSADGYPGPVTWKRLMEEIEREEKAHSEEEGEIPSHYRGVLRPR